MKSIIQNEKVCYICGAKTNLHLHHIFFGIRNRRKADKDKLAVYLCYEHHEGTFGVHGKNGHNLDMSLKKIGQATWMSYYHKTEKDFIKKYGRNYLE